MRRKISDHSARTFKWVREQYQMNLRQFSIATGISVGMLSMIEKGKRRPGGITILKLQEFTGQLICDLRYAAKCAFDGVEGLTVELIYYPNEQ
ncbi:helix-turn-helix domain-containing protein [Sanyastnella coralliicola]|uniref:helix-turn-helix domain-containing protein n=1 Tax=Sanyastnella coralliicola TaxID=3069118 RepID=UPI0027BA3D09|nr:helix-turn-helix transcriptional regulator [Longitalea sp. SCSIO 12813]